MYQDRIIKKIPGEPSPGFKKEHQGYIDSLTNKRKFELLDLLERQNKLLANKKFVAKLPDKGEKILKFKADIMKEIEQRDEVDLAANLLSRLNIASQGKEAMNELEWTGEYDEKSSVKKVVDMESDDEVDPLKILAQPTGTGVQGKKIVVIETEETLITTDDLKEIESFQNSSSEDPEYIKHLVDKVENFERNDHERSFKPYKTTKTNVHDPEIEKMRKKGKNWESTAATPPLTIHGAIKTISLQESFQLQKEQAVKLQEIQAKHAIERLTQQIGRNAVEENIRISGNYRTNDKDSDSSSSDEAEEVHDDEDHDKAGTVVFTVDSVEY